VSVDARLLTVQAGFVRVILVTGKGTSLTFVSVITRDLDSPTRITPKSVLPPGYVSSGLSTWEEMKIVSVEVSLETTNVSIDTPMLLPWRICMTIESPGAMPRFRSLVVSTLSTNIYQLRDLFESIIRRSTSTLSCERLRSTTGVVPEPPAHLV
jgi:hypothetical protein